jgi:hypothetical protein
MPFYYPQFPQPGGNYPFPYPTMPTGLPGAPAAPTVPAQTEETPCEYPDIVSWFQYLNGHNGCNQDNIIFAPFGTVLKKKGFI